MKDAELYSKILGLSAPWYVGEVDLNMAGKSVTINIKLEPNATLHCPVCNGRATRYDSNTRMWRHLDTMQFATLVKADVPRVECAEHGILQVSVPWAEARSRFTAMFESLVISWLLEASTSAVARNLNLTWDEVDGIRQRAVERGIARREVSELKNLCVDETSYKRGHRYLTIISDQDSGVVLEIKEDRKKESLTSFLETLTTEERSAIESVSMDMFPAYIGAVQDWIPDADNKICFDRFHVAQYLSRAVDLVRRSEHKALMKNGDTTLTKTRYDWLRDPSTMRRKTWLSFKELVFSTLKTARAWMIKESAKHLWNYATRTWAVKQWTAWYKRAIRSRLEPVKDAARTINNNLWGIINAIVLGKSNAKAESINSKIQTIKSRARGFHSPERFRIAILFHCGGLDMYPSGSHF